MRYLQCLSDLSVIMAEEIQDLLDELGVKSEDLPTPFGVHVEMFALAVAAWINQEFGLGPIEGSGMPSPALLDALATQKYLRHADIVEAIENMGPSERSTRRGKAGDGLRR